MGYRTNYSITYEITITEDHPEYDIYHYHATQQEVSDLIEEKSYLEIFECCPGEVSGCGKWYEWDEHMREVSSLYPHYRFSVEGHGEEDEDIWIAYFQNGKGSHEHAVIAYPEYDPEKMK